MSRDITAALEIMTKHLGTSESIRLYDGPMPIKEYQLKCAQIDMLNYNLENDKTMTPKDKARAHVSVARLLSEIGEDGSLRRIEVSTGYLGFGQ
jgi:hypothetical protein